MMNWEKCRRKPSWPNIKCYPGICLEGLSKSTKDFNQDSWSMGQDLNTGPLTYKAAVLSICTGYSVKIVLGML